MMEDEGVEALCACACGASKLSLTGPPLLRFICHCPLCQAVYQKPFADVTMVRAQDVEIGEDAHLEFKKHRPPPNVNRGVCSKCGNPVVGFMWLPPFPRMAFVPSANFPEASVLPEPFGHIFYRSRQADVADDLPKHQGYWASESAVTLKVMKALMRGSARA